MDLTINWYGGQHSQLLRCYFIIHFLPSICKGDSGGPMYSIRDQKRYELVAFKCFLKAFQCPMIRWIMICIWAFFCFIKTMLLIRWGQLHSTMTIVMILGWENTYFELFIHFCEWSDSNAFSFFIFSHLCLKKKFCFDFAHFFYFCVFSIYKCSQVWRGQWIGLRKFWRKILIPVQKKHDSFWKMVWRIASSWYVIINRNICFEADLLRKKKSRALSTDSLLHQSTLKNILLFVSRQS